MEWNGMEWNGMEWNGMEWKDPKGRCTAPRSAMEGKTVAPPRVRLPSNESSRLGQPFAAHKREPLRLGKTWTPQSSQGPQRTPRGPTSQPWVSEGGRRYGRGGL
eukprot:2764241-Pyramimonas_sp.AAC.1